MISFEEFVIADGIPIYLQIVNYIKRGIASGAVRDQEEIPSRRVLASLLGVNPNTVQKAYRMLEEEGLIESRSGAKSCISINKERRGLVRDELMEHDAKAVVSIMKQMGMAKEDAVKLIEKFWE